MIPILYFADETVFRTNGIGRLSDCVRCIATEERNGIYEVEFDYPITGKHYEDLKLGRIVACTHDDRRDIQPFIIYQRTVPDLRGVVTFYAHHISYRLNNTVVMPFSAGTVATALQGIKTNSVNANPFSFWTDKSTVATFKSEVPRMARAMLGGEQNSILDVFGSGEYEFDRFEVKLYANRGNDTDVEIRYSKNLMNLSETISLEGTFNAIVPFWADPEGNVVMLPEKILVYSGIEPQIAYLTDHNLIIIRTETDEPIEVAYSQINAAPYDMSEYFEEAPTVAQLRNAARNRFENSGAWLPSENLTVDFVQLWQTEEFKDFAALQRVRLCDTVSVFYPQAGVNQVKQKVVRTAYNVLLDRYDEIELGTLSSTLGQAIKTEILQEVPTTSMMESAIQYATDMIRGGLGGYVVMTPGPNGYPQEILIMDTPDINTAVNVWRFNQGGLGHSSSGYDGPFSDIALTQDGKINASMITTGTLNANLIRAGTLQDVNGNVSWNLATGVLNMTKGSINLGSGKFVATDAGKLTAIGGGVIRDPNSNTIFNLDSGLLIINKGSINLGNGNFYVTDAGYLEAKSGKIAGLTLSASNMQYLSSARLLSVSSEEVSSGNSWSGGGKSKVTLKEGKVQFYANTTATGEDWNLPLAGSISMNPFVNTMAIINELGTCRIELRQDLIYVGDDTYIAGDVQVTGTKNRRVNTANYSERLLYCYETPTPLFGDIGEATIDEDGFGFVDIDDIFSETIAERCEYQVFLQKEGEGDCYVSEKNPRYFVIQGTPGLKVAWELKAKQKDYQNIRLEQPENSLETYSHESADDLLNSDAISEMEGLLYEFY